MTKERSLAIQMWEEILEHQPCTVFIYKDRFCSEHRLSWTYGCWFCEYVRQDFRLNLLSRLDIPEDFNGCQKCPIYKYNKCEGDACGCEGGIFEQACKASDVFRRKEATKIIIRLLKGEKLWDTGEV